MGLAGIPLDIMTITIAAIVVGIGVDDCIHYIHRFRVEFKKDRDYEAAMYRSHASIGRRDVLHHRDGGHWLLPINAVKFHAQLVLWCFDRHGDGRRSGRRFTASTEIIVGVPTTGAECWVDQWTVVTVVVRVALHRLSRKGFGACLRVNRPVYPAST